MATETGTPVTPLTTASEFTKAAGQVIAGIGGVVALVVVMGAAVLIGRVSASTSASVLGIVPQVSEDVLIGFGVEVAVAPVAFGAIYAINRLVTSGAKPDDNRRWGLPMVLLIVGPALCAWGYDAFIRQGGNIPVRWGSLVLILLIGIGVVNAAWVMYDKIRTRAAEWNSLPTVLAVSVLVTLATFPGIGFVIGSLPLQKAVVCVDAGNPDIGYLIGDGSTGTFIVEAGSHHILTVPSDHVVRIWSGPNVWTYQHNAPTSATRCPPSPPGS
jgi:hypothetical protein